jgi:hypothetical protein
MAPPSKLIGKKAQNFPPSIELSDFAAALAFAAILCFAALIARLATALAFATIQAFAIVLVRCGR